MEYQRLMTEDSDLPEMNISLTIQSSSSAMMGFLLMDPRRSLVKTSGNGLMASLLANVSLILNRIFCTWFMIMMLFVRPCKEIARGLQLLYFLFKRSICTAANTCDRPFIENGSFEDDTQNEYGVGDMVVFECDEGFRLSGKKKITCESDGQWSDRFPTCKGKFTKILFFIFSSDNQQQ